MNNALPYATLPNEAARLLAVSRYRNVGNIQDQVFDELVRLTAALCEVPMAFISLVEEHSVWFKYTIGWLGAQHLARQYTLCSVAILRETSSIFPDLKKEPCQQMNPAEIETLNLQYYAGAPLITREGYAIGILAICHNQPRLSREEDEILLAVFAALVVALMELYHTSATNQQAVHFSSENIYSEIEQSIRWMNNLFERTMAKGNASETAILSCKQEIRHEAQELTQRIKLHLAPPTAWT